MGFKKIKFEIPKENIKGMFATTPIFKEIYVT